MGDQHVYSQLPKKSWFKHFVALQQDLRANEGYNCHSYDIDDIGTAYERQR